MSDEADDDPQLKSLRAVWLSMPDEEPPERGLAELMAAARVKADEMAKPSLWHRITALLRRPPVLALATVLVLIGGAVFIGQRKDKMGAEPTAEVDRTRDVAQPSAGAAPAATAPASPAQQQEHVAVPAPADEAEPAEPHAAPPAEPKKGPPRAPTRRPSSPKPDTTSAVRGEGKPINSEDGLRLGGADDSGPARAATEKPKVEKTTTTKTLDENKISSDSFAPEAAPSESPTAGATAPTVNRAPQPAPSRAPQYVAQAKSAAARGDCAAARTMMKQVAKEDAAAHRKALDGDAALKKCVIVAQ
ncbi:MAG TPA: hypothetical protein VIV11_08815 [Kofleriaceae bacterium]